MATTNLIHVIFSIGVFAVLMQKACSEQCLACNHAISVSMSDLSLMRSSYYSQSSSSSSSSSQDSEMSYTSGCNDCAITDKKLRSWGFHSLQKIKRKEESNEDRARVSWEKLMQIMKICTEKSRGIEMKRLDTGVYYFHTDMNTSMNWFQARDFCRSHGMDLVSIESKLENDLIKHQVIDLLKEVFPSALSFFWIGLNDLGKAGVYTWTGTGKPMAYTDWLADNNAPDGDGQCGEIFQHKYIDNVHWNDRDCVAWKGRFICELDDACANLWDIYHGM